jgi:hypothetical protein
MVFARLRCVGGTRVACNIFCDIFVAVVPEADPDRRPEVLEPSAKWP